MLSVPASAPRAPMGMRPNRLTKQCFGDTPLIYLPGAVRLSELTLSMDDGPTLQSVL